MENKCETCGNKDPLCANGFCQYVPKPAPANTVLTDDEAKLLSVNFRKGISWEYYQREEQDTYTRQKLIEQGWKSPGQIDEIRALAQRDGIDHAEYFTRQLVTQEQDTLTRQEYGKEILEKLREIKLLSQRHDGTYSLRDQVLERLDALIQQLEGK